MFLAAMRPEGALEPDQSQRDLRERGDSRDSARASGVLLPAVAAVLAAVVLGNVAAMGLSVEVAAMLADLGVLPDVAHAVAYGGIVVLTVAIAAFALRLVSGMDDDTE